MWQSTRVAVQSHLTTSLLILVLSLCSSLVEGLGLVSLIPLLLFSDYGASLVHQVSLPSVLSGLQVVQIPLWVILMAYVVLITLVASLRFGAQRLQDRLRIQLTAWFRSRLYDALLNASYTHLQQLTSTHLVPMLTVQVHRSATVLTGALQLLNSLIMVGVYAVVLGVYSWHALLLVAGIGLLSAAIVVPLNRQIRQRGQQDVAKLMRFGDIVQQVAASLKQLKANASEQVATQQFDQSVGRMALVESQYAGHQLASRWLFMVAGAVAMATLLGVAVYGFQLPLVALMMLVIVSGRLMPRLGTLLNSAQQLLFNLPSLEQLESVISQAMHHQEPVLTTTNAVHFLDKIVCDHVTFSYKDQPVITAFSGEIKQGELLAIRGRSGAGKSTLLDLICGLQYPSEGAVAVDGVSLDAQHSRQWRAQIAYLNQVPLLYRGTIRDNLCWGRDDQLTDDDLWQALDQVNASQFVKDLPNQLDTELIEFGLNLSGGERQRLCLARLLLQPASLLILDEALTYLDQQSKDRVRETLVSLKGERTVIVVSHDEDLIGLADQVWELS